MSASGSLPGLGVASVVAIVLLLMGLSGDFHLGGRWLLVARWHR